MPFKDTKTASDRIKRKDRYKLHAAILMGLTTVAYYLLTI